MHPIFRYLQISLAFTILVALAPIAAPNAARAAGPAEQVAGLEVAGKLAADGSLTITETINYSFGSAAPHPVLYRLPVSYRDGQGRTYRLQFALESAKVNGDSFSPEPKVTQDIISIDLPLPAVLPAPESVTSYELRYRLSPVVMSGPDGVALKYPVTGLGWPVPVAKATFKLDTAGRGIEDVHCATGAPGVTTASCSIESTADAATVQTEAPLNANEGLSVILSFKPGTVENYLEADDGPGGLSWWVAPAAVLAVVLAALVGLTLARRRRGRYTGAKDEASPHRPYTP